MKQILVVILFVFAIQLHASELAKHPYYKEINHFFGLPSMHIFDLHVAKSGLLFLGTDKGLFSYDGIQFKSYDFVNNLANAVDRIQEDDKGRIWCKNFSNQIFVLQGDKLWLYKLAEVLLSKLDANLVDFKLTASGIWILTEKEVIQINENNQAKCLIKLPRSQDHSSFFSIAYEPTTKHVLIGETNYLYRISPSGNVQKTRVYSGQKTITVSDEHVFYELKGEENKLFFSKDSKNFKNIYVDAKNYIIKTSVTDLGVWLCTSNGVFNINLEKMKIDFPFLVGRKVTDVVQDQEGNLWFSTLGDGLIFVPSLKIQKINVNKNSNNRSIFTAITIDDKGHLFIGTMNGLVLELNKSYELIKTYDTQKNKEIEHLYVSKDYVSTSDGRFDRQGNIVEAEIKYYKDFAEDDMGNYVFGSYNLAGIVSKGKNTTPNTENYFKDKELAFYDDSEKAIIILRTKRTRAVHFHRENRMYYIGASDGLFVFGPDGQEFELRTKDNNPIIASSIKSDSDGNIWVGALQNGIFKIKDNEIIDFYNAENGLSDDNTKKIHIDASGIWIINDKGLDFINPNTNSISRLSRYSGLNGLDLFGVTSQKNQIWLLTNEGILAIDKSAFVTPDIPKVDIKNVSANETKIGNLNVLGHDKNNIVFELQTIHFRSLGNYAYEYRLLGLSDIWKTQSSSLSQINYLALDPGSYTFQVRVIIGDISSDIQEFKFTIKKAFWMTTWFLLLMLLFIAGLFYFIFQKRLESIRKKQKIREQLALSQITALRTQMNPHFMFNILNAFQGLIYSNQKTQANEFLGVFSDLMRKTLDMSDKREVSIQDELEAIDLYVSLEKARFVEEEFEYTFETDIPEELKNYAIPSLILQPFIENAIKHGLLHRQGIKKLKLSISKENDQYWRFEIEDNGIGREQSYTLNKNLKKHDSFATQAIDSRIGLINRLSKVPIHIDVIDLKDDANKALGTRVVLKIPIKLL